MDFIARKSLMCLLVVLSMAALLALQTSSGESDTGPVVIEGVTGEFGLESAPELLTTLQGGWPQSKPE